MDICVLLVSILDKLSYVEPSKSRPVTAFQGLDGPDIVLALRSLYSGEGTTFTSV